MGAAIHFFTRYYVSWRSILSRGDALIVLVPSPWPVELQVKWYMLLLAVANWLDVLFRFAMDVGLQMTKTWEGSEASCKFLVFLRTMGPSLAAMAVAALALHVLLTAITGCQGDRLRHVLVMGLFVLLSLPLPLSQVSRELPTIPVSKINS